MPYLGTPAAVGFSKTTKDRFSGDNSTTGFTMSQAANTATDIQVFVDNIRQEPTIAYSTSGATLTFTEAPPTGTNNVYVVHQHQALGTGTLPPQDLGSKDYIFGDDISFNSDGAVINFGLDSEIKLVHVHNSGLSLNTDGHALLFGADSEVSLTHVADTGLLLNSTSKLMFGDSASFIHQSSDGNLKLDGESTVEIASTSGVKLTGTTPTLTIGDAGAEDTKIVFDGNAQDFHIGLDDSADSLTIGLGSALGTTSHMIFDANGHITKPLQSAFHVINNTDLANITTNNTENTVKFDNESYDVNADFNTTSFTFTAPVTGKYQFNVSLSVSQIDTAASQYLIRLVTSNRNYHLAIDPEFSSDVLFPFSISALADMDASDTATVTIAQNGGTAQTDVRADPGSHFSGFLAC